MIMKMMVEATLTGARVSGLRGMDGWAVETDAATGAVTLVPPPGRAVTSKEWRMVPLAAVLRAAEGVQTGDLVSSLLTMLASDGEDPTRSSRGGKRQHMERVSRVYRAALSQGLSPREVIVEHFQTKDSSAGRWIAQARKEGYLGSYADEARYAWPKHAGRKVGPDGEPLPPVPVTADQLRVFPEPIKRNTGRARSTPTRTNASTGSEDQK
ncbi:hypothetical protein [Plantibacter cousiniae (nom. nud.)]|uniref:hypothetical protein n=1 Tax=Plantibacter cousiniae (nom. nud.) TaxID=199709 RepID=UPI001E487424|nr:hypothetical protein [Plantibacter cousiniae]